MKQTLQHKLRYTAGCFILSAGLSPLLLMLAAPASLGLFNPIAAVVCVLLVAAGGLLCARNHHDSVAAQTTTD